MKTKYTGSKIFSICGPSGSGKTTLVKALAAEFSIYIEGVDRNPYLNDLHQSVRSFDAFSNQQWFISEISNAILFADSTKPLILDQDPAAIVYVYAKLFFDQGMMTSVEYTKLSNSLVKTEESLKRWQQPRRLIMLNASSKVLKKRVDQRGDASMPIDFYEDIVRRFQQFSQGFQTVFHVYTDNMSSDGVSKCVRDYIKQTLEEAKAAHK